MATNKRSHTQIQNDRTLIARLHLQGWSQQAITRHINEDPDRPYTLTAAMVSFDIKAVRKEWQKERITDIDERQTQELAKIDHLERTYWQAWERSCQDTTETTRYIGVDGDATPKPTRAQVKKIEHLGMPQFLDGINRCIAQRCKILGLNAPEQITTPPGQPLQHEFDFSTLSTEQLLTVRDLLLSAQSGPRGTE